MSTKSNQRALRSAVVDAMIATYAPIGAEQKRRLRRKRATTGLAGAVLVAAAAMYATSDVSLVDELGQLLPRQASGLSQREADQLAAERSEFSAKLALLEKRLAAAQQQEAELKAERAEFAEQSRRIAVLLDAADSEQSQLRQRQDQGLQLDQEIAAIATQRKALEQRWAQFEAQGELLAMEIVAVNAQRKELEAQRQKIDRQQQVLDAMLERAHSLYRRNPSSADADPSQDARTRAIADDDFVYTENSLMVDNSELDEMRGGFSIGDGLDVSIGFEQTGSINGVEQYSNNFSIDSVGSGFSSVDMSNMNSVVLQNGNGNFVSASVIDNLADSFGNIIQNTLDDQVISTTTTYDISLHNTPGTLQGLAGEQALQDSLGAF